MELYLHQNGEQVGPYTEEQIISMVSSGELSRDDIIWHEGLAEWQPIHSVVSFPASVAPQPAPVQQAQPASPQSTQVETNVKQGAIIGGWVCFALGLICMFLSLFMFFLYGPFFLVAFILSIVAMSQRRVLGGVMLLVATLVVPSVLGLVLFATRATEFADGISKSIEETSVSASSATNAAEIQFLPPLTEKQLAEAEQLQNGLETREDEIEGITWIKPRVGEGYKTAIYLYIGKKSSEPWLRWNIRYHGDDWLFVRRYRVKIDDSEPITLDPSKAIDRDNSGGSVWETFDEAAAPHAALINRILASGTTRIRMEGSDGIEDVELNSTDIQRMKDVLLVFRSLGGKWPAE